MEVDDEQRQHSNLNAGRDYYRSQGIARESLKVPPIELGGNRRFEEFVAYIGARHVRTPLAVIPKQRFR